MGIEFDPWQVGAARLILSKRADGSYACSIGGVVISIPRQVGKTFLIGAIVFALCALFPRLTVLWTAHHTATANETFNAMQGFADRARVAPHVDKILVDDMMVLFTNGSRILFGARERGFGRGFTDVAVLVFDEAQILTERAIDDMLPSTNTAANPLLLLMGTPPKPSDPSEVFTVRRSEALTGTADDIGYIEFSADDDANPDHRRQWRKANPSYPKRTPVSSILRMQRNLTPDSFRREALGIWDAAPNTSTPSVIDLDRWAATVVAKSPAGQPAAFGVKFSASGELVALAGAVHPEAGPIHVEGIDRRLVLDGTRWLVTWLQARRALVVIDGKAGAGALAIALRRAGVPARRIRRPTVDEVITAHAGFVGAVHAGELTHLDDPAFEIESVVRRQIGKAGGWGFTGKAGADVTLLEAAVLAHWGAESHKPTRGRRTSRRRAVTL